MKTATQLGFRIRHIRYGALVGVLVGGAIGVITSFLDKIDIIPPVMRGILIGAILGAAIKFYEEFLFQSKFRRKSYFFLLLARKLLYVLTFSFTLILVNTVSALIEYDFTISKALHFSVIEGGNWSGGQSSGDVVTIFNRNRQNQNSSTLLINHVTGLWYSNSGQIMTDLTGAGGGTTIFQSFAFAAKNQTAQLTRGRNEIVLNTGTQYIFELEADAGTSAGQIELEWYEET